MQMRGITIFILLIPAMVAIGHDTYLFYQEHLNPGIFSIDLLMEKFKFSALGFIWTTYSLETYESVVQTTDKDTWSVIDQILTFKTFYAGLLFAGIFIFLFTIFSFAGIGPFASEEGSKSAKEKEIESFRSGAQSKKMKYKRK